MTTACVPAGQRAGADLFTQGGGSYLLQDVQVVAEAVEDGAAQTEEDGAHEPAGGEQQVGYAEQEERLQLQRQDQHFLSGLRKKSSVTTATPEGRLTSGFLLSLCVSRQTMMELEPRMLQTEEVRPGPDTVVQRPTCRRC